MIPSASSWDPDRPREGVQFTNDSTAPVDIMADSTSDIPDASNPPNAEKRHTIIELVHFHFPKKQGLRNRIRKKDSLSTIQGGYRNRSRVQDSGSDGNCYDDDDDDDDDINGESDSESDGQGSSDEDGNPSAWIGECIGRTFYYPNPARSREGYSVPTITFLFRIEPKLQYVEWPAFKAGGINMVNFEKHHDMDPYWKSSTTGPAAVTEASAIDVLLGAPLLRGSYQSPESQYRPSHLDTLRNGGVDPGQYRLPERMRINSQVILASFPMRFPRSGTSSLTFVRPYRALVHLDAEIRRVCSRLEEEVMTNTTNPSAFSDQPNGSDKTGEITCDASDGRTMRPTEKLAFMKCLREFLDVHVVPRIRYVTDPQCMRVYFEDLWYLFQPGDDVAEIKVHGQLSDIQVYRIISTSGFHHDRNMASSSIEGVKHETCRISMVSIDFDGQQLGPVPVDRTIGHFEGERPIQWLPVIPINRLRNDELRKHYYQRNSELPQYSDDEHIRQSLADRGRMFIRLTKVSHMHFNGFTELNEELDCAVIVDIEEYFGNSGTTESDKEMPRLKSLIDWQPVPGTMPRRQCACCLGTDVVDDTFVDDERRDRYISRLSFSRASKLPPLSGYPRYREQINMKDEPLTRDDLLIMPYSVHCFIPQLRDFRKLPLNRLTPMGSLWKESLAAENITDHNVGGAFDELVLPDGHKKMVKSLIAQHFRDKNRPFGMEDQLDFIRGKGKGLIILLHGAPGVGKTTTAECVADFFRKPLYQLTCGDLGMWPDQVDRSLRQIFAQATRWGCILLLDEADVFLTTRSPSDLLRNGLVSVFLRVMEYYSGILFLTTNRVGDFDEAVASRVHLSLFYPPLGLDATIAIFGLNLNRLQQRCDRRNIKLQIKMSSILAGASQHFHENPEARWNGRQIRNACQTAFALAEFDAKGGDHEAILQPGAVVTLDIKHFTTVTQSYLGFAQYLAEIYGVNPDERARENQMRAGVANSQATASLLRGSHHPEGSFHQKFMNNPRSWSTISQPTPYTPGSIPSPSVNSRPYHTGFSSQKTPPHTFTSNNFSPPSHGQPYQVTAATPAQYTSDPQTSAGRPYDQQISGGYPDTLGQSPQSWVPGVGSVPNPGRGATTVGITAAPAPPGVPQVVSHQPDAL